MRAGSIELNYADSTKFRLMNSPMSLLTTELRIVVIDCYQSGMLGAGLSLSSDTE